MRINNVNKKFMKKACLYLLVVLFLLNPALFFQSSQAVNAQGDIPIKENPVPSEAGAGETTKITIRVPGKNSVVRQQADTMLVMDVTGSMAEAWDWDACDNDPATPNPPCTKWDAAKAALSYFVQQTTWDDPPGAPVEEWDRTGLVAYSEALNPQADESLIADMDEIISGAENSASGARSFADAAAAEAAAGRRRGTIEAAENAVSKANGVVGAAGSLLELLQTDNGTRFPIQLNSLEQAIRDAESLISGAEEIIDAGGATAQIAQAADTAATAAEALLETMKDLVDTIRSQVSELRHAWCLICLPIAMDSSG